MDLSSIDSDHELCDSSGDDTGVDNDLTNLTWLQDRNLLQNIKVCTNDTTNNDLTNEDNENVSPPPDLTANTDVTNKSITTVPPVTYNPHLHRNAKPPYSFSSLIFMAIESSPNKALPVKDIYQWIVEHYPYYQTAPSGWKNTVRHNLSLNKCFRKLDKTNDEQLIPIVGKGSLWCVDPDLRPNLLQAVRRTPAHIYPYMSLAKTNPVAVPPRIQLSSNSANNTSQQHKKALSSERVQSVVNIPSPNLFPFLSKRLLIPITKIMKKVEKETDAAVSMLTLQSNPENTVITADDTQDSNSSNEILSHQFVDDLNESVVTVTVSPSGDHNYYQRDSTEPEVYSSVYQVIELTDQLVDNNSTNKRKYLSIEFKKEDDDSNEEGMRGAEALLNLASSNKALTQHDRPIILKKCKKE